MSKRKHQTFSTNSKSRRERQLSKVVGAKAASGCTHGPDDANEKGECPCGFVVSSNKSRDWHDAQISAVRQRHKAGELSIDEAAELLKDLGVINVNLYL